MENGKIAVFSFVKIDIINKIKEITAQIIVCFDVMLKRALMYESMHRIAKKVERLAILWQIYVTPKTFTGLVAHIKVDKSAIGYALFSNLLRMEGRIKSPEQQYKKQKAVQQMNGNIDYMVPKRI